jgi:hypothetical protein
MCGQRTATKWVGEMARKHGFRILTGEYPAFMYPETGGLDQAILEVGVLREEMYRLLESDGRSSEQDKKCLLDQWDRLLARLKQLKDEPEAEAYFG